MTSRDVLLNSMLFAIVIGIIGGVAAFVVAFECESRGRCRPQSSSTGIQHIVETPPHPTDEPTPTKTVQPTHTALPSPTASTTAEPTATQTPIPLRTITSRSDEQTHATATAVASTRRSQAALKASPESTTVVSATHELHITPTAVVTRRSIDWLDESLGNGMIITGGYDSLVAARVDAIQFEEAGYPILVFFRKGSFRTGIIGYDNEEQRLSDLSNIRRELRDSAYLRELSLWCPLRIERTGYIECVTD